MKHIDKLYLLGEKLALSAGSGNAKHWSPSTKTAWVVGGCLVGCFAESKTYPDDGTCMRRAFSPSSPPASKRYFPIIKKFVRSTKPERLRVPEEGYQTLRLHDNAISQAWSAESEGTTSAEARTRRLLAKSEPDCRSVSEGGSHGERPSAACRPSGSKRIAEPLPSLPQQAVALSISLN